MIYRKRDIPADLARYFVRAELGLEPTPDAYVANMVEVFREVRRVLTDDGTLFLNIGDSYAGSDKGGNPEGSPYAGFHGNKARETSAKASPPVVPLGMKPKDLIGIPWLVAFALRADGWYLRSDIIWAKPNPMPESVTDRPTKSHEYVFLLSKSRRYYYDAEAIKEAGLDTGKPDAPLHDTGWDGRRDGTVPGKGEAHASGTRTGGNLSRAYAGVNWGERGRNARTVWTIPTKPYSGAHFATMPPELARRCIMAGSAPGDTVLDPFGGSGTTASVAVGCGRKALHIELNPAYRALAVERIGPAFVESAA